MKIAEFKQIIDVLADSPISKGDEVMVEMAESGIPCRPMVKVKEVNQGFDWTQGRVIIRLEEPVIRKKNKKEEPKNIVVGPPPTAGHKVKSLYVVVAITPQGDEGICASIETDLIIPLMASKETSCKTLLAAASKIKQAKPEGKIVLRRYDYAVDVEEVV
jgi:hypothetical protein